MRLSRRASSGPRTRSLDILRGIAIALMVLDHVCVVTGEGGIFRLTITRLSMPLFFLISGHLLSRIDWKRLVIVGIIGACLPYYVTFIEVPNVLFLYALFAPLIVWQKNKPRGLAVITAFGLGMYANGFGLIIGAYAPFALLGLMALGRLMSRDLWIIQRWEGERVSRFVTPFTLLGKYPLSIYVGHLIILEGLRRM